MRAIFKVITATSMAACIATAILTIRSYWVKDWFFYNRRSWSAFVVTADGEWRLEHTYAVDRRWRKSTIGFEHRTAVTEGRGVFPDMVPGEWLHFRKCGFAYVTGVRWDGYHYAFFAPGWFFIVASTVLPGILLIRRGLSARRIRNGACADCGYDLRASPDRCPECGTPVRPGGAAGRGHSERSRDAGAPATEPSDTSRAFPPPPRGAG